MMLLYIPGSCLFILKTDLSAYVVWFPLARVETTKMSNEVCAGQWIDSGMVFCYGFSGSGCTLLKSMLPNFMNSFIYPWCNFYMTKEHMVYPLLTTWLPPRSPPLLVIWGWQSLQGAKREGLRGSVTWEPIRCLEAGAWVAEPHTLHQPHSHSAGHCAGCSLQGVGRGDTKPAALSARDYQL